MSEMLSQPKSNPEHEQTEATIVRQHVVGRLRELGVEEELDYLLDEESFDDNELLGEIATLATMYDLDIDDVLRETSPIERRIKNEFGEPFSDEI